MQAGVRCHLENRKVLLKVLRIGRIRRNPKGPFERQRFEPPKYQSRDGGDIGRWNRRKKFGKGILDSISEPAADFVRRVA